MRPDKLEDLILRHKAEGKTPFFVNATAGTTVKGAFDPINEIANICEKHDLWLHVDVSWHNFEEYVIQFRYHTKTLNLVDPNILLFLSII